jgi:hypothetical protein
MTQTQTEARPESAANMMKAEPQNQDVIEFRSDDRRTLSARVLEANGNWKHFMTVEYRRMK